MNWLKILPTRKNDRYIRYVIETDTPGGDGTYSFQDYRKVYRSAGGKVPTAYDVIKSYAYIPPCVAPTVTTHKRFYSRKELQEFVDEYFNTGYDNGYYRGYMSASESDNRVHSKVVNILTEKIKKLESHNNATLKFKVKLDGKEYQVRIFVNDPVTCARISTDDGWYADGTTIRHPKDQWSSKIAVAKSLADAVIQFFTTDVEIDNTTVKIDQNIYNAFFDAMFKKYPEMRTK